MAARLNPRHQDTIREKIRASQLVNRLENHVLGKGDSGEQVELSTTQVTAALGLLKKCVPDLKATEHTGKDGEALFPEILELTIVRPKKRSDPTDA